MLASEGIRNGGYITQPRSPDGRFAKRRKTTIPASILSSDLAQPLACIVRDTSSSGALIELQGAGGRGSDAQRLGDTFTLVMPRELVQFDCRIAWRQANLIGVRFVAPARVIQKQESRMSQRQQKPQTLVGKLIGAAGLGKKIGTRL